MKNETNPLEVKIYSHHLPDTWIAYSIANYVSDRVSSTKWGNDEIENTEDQIERLRWVFANLIEKLYNTRTLNLKDIANIIGEMPSNVRKRKVK